MNRRIRHGSIWLFVSLALSLDVAGRASAQDRLFRDERPAMGSTFAVSVYAPDPSSAEAAIEVAFEEIERIEQLLSDYRPTSELSRVNRMAANDSVTVDPELFNLLERVRELSVETGGAFDPTVGALVDTWGFGTDSPSVPSEEAIRKALSVSGLQHVVLNAEHRTVQFDRDGVRIDPGAFGKGYAADRAAHVLEESGTSRALVNAGSSTFRALGPPPGEPGWIVRVGDDTLYAVHSGLSISGQNQRRFEACGVVFGHILDPRTGFPAVSGRLSVVVASDATRADALSTALYVLGPGHAAETFRNLGEVSARVLPAPTDSFWTYLKHWPPGIAASDSSHW